MPRRNLATVVLKDIKLQALLELGSDTWLASREGMPEKSAPAVKVLLVCGDPEMIDLLCDIMEQLNILPVRTPRKSTSS